MRLMHCEGARHGWTKTQIKKKNEERLLIVPLVELTAHDWQELYQIQKEILTEEAIPYELLWQLQKKANALVQIDCTAHHCSCLPVPRNERSMRWYGISERNQSRMT